MLSGTSTVFDSGGARGTRWLGLVACFCFACPGVEPTALVGGAGGEANTGAGPTTSSGGHNQGGGGETSGTGGKNAGGNGGVGGAGGCSSPDLTTDIDNCGECGRACLVDDQVKLPRCVDGVCKSFCVSGFVNINQPDMGPDDGCEAPGRRVFVTEALMMGPDIGSIPEGDDLCQAAADTVELGGAWAAWLSDGLDPNTLEQRFVTQPEAPYLLVDGTPVSDSWATLTNLNAMLQHPINMTESQSTVPNVTSRVWTGTGPQGLATLQDCNGWTTGIAVGTVGDATKTTSVWTQSLNPISCTETARLYCFEQ